MIASAAVPWPALVEQLPQFNHVLFFDLSCPQHGDWRSAIPVDSKSRRLQCPRCGELRRAVIVARGLVQTDVPWLLVSPALKRGRNFKLGRLKGRPKTAEVTGRVTRTAYLLAQGMTAPEIARELGLSSSHFHLFAKRREKDIEWELAKARSGS